MKKIIINLLMMVIFLSGFFVLINYYDSIVNKVEAQEIPSYDIRVFILRPNIDGITIPTIWGQTTFDFKFEGITPIEFADVIESFILEVYDSPSSTATHLGNFNISEYHQDSEQPYIWHFNVDTMNFLDSSMDYYVRLRAFSNHEITLIHGMNGDYAFGPIKIENISNIISPEENQKISNQAILKAKLRGDAKAVKFEIYNIGNNSTPLITLCDTEGIVTASGETDTHWDVEFDTSTFANGLYSLVMGYTTLGSVQLNNVDESVFEIFNTINDPGDPCTPEWQCQDWPAECLSTEVLIRNCMATNCGETQTTTESADCEYQPPADPNDNTNSNLNTNTSIPDSDGSDNDLTPLPIVVPTIEMKYPAQGDTVSGDIVLKAITNASIYKLDFLYKPKDINIEEFIGQANRSLNNNLLWQRPWGTDEIPSGQYKVYARATMSDGLKYLSNYIIIKIDHENFDLNTDNITTEEVIPYNEDSTTDSDGDGVDDYTEENLGIDPNKPNMTEEYSGLLDKAMAEGKITLAQATRLKTGLIIDQPKNSNLQPSSNIKVVKVENISPRIGQNNLVISGLGPANTTLKLYIYSDPIVVTTKTDASGNFTYILDKDLLDGEHEVYVTINDDTGKIIEQSNPLTFFIRRAQAVTEEEYLRGDVNIDSDSNSVVSKFVIPATITVVALILVFIGIFMIKRKEEQIK